MKKNDLNVLKYGFYGYKLRYKYKNIPQIFRNIKYAYQRITRGWCDQDIWNMDIYLAELLPSMLEHLANNHFGIPCLDELNDELVKSEGYKDKDDKWTKILEEIAYHFKNCIEDSDYNYAQKQANYLMEEMDLNIKRSWLEELETGGSSILREEYYDDNMQEKLRSKWRKEVEKSQEFMEEEKNKACDMLKKYFFNLWD